jgi:hypothetical protein
MVIAFEVLKRSLSEGMEGIIGNGNSDAPTVVTIALTDAGFQSYR